MKGFSNFGIIVLWVFLGGGLFLHIFQGWNLPFGDRLFFFLLGVGVILILINSSISKVESTLLEKFLNISSSEGNRKISIENEKVKDGSFEEFYPNGSLKLVGDCKNGKRDGVWKEYFENGILREQGVFKDGKKDGGFWIYDEDGSKIEELVFESGILRESLNRTNKNFNGIKKFYSEEGMLVRTLTYEEGKIHYLNDLKINYYGNGGLIYSYGNYKDGVKDGIWVIFNGLETPVWIEYYKDGVHEVYDDYKDFQFSECSNWDEINLRDLKLTRSGTYFNDKEHGCCKYFGSSGNLISKYYHLNDEGSEIREFFDSNEQLVERNTYKNDHLNGHYEKFHKNGKLESKGNNTFNKSLGGVTQIGICESFFENGQLRSIGEYSGTLSGAYLPIDDRVKGIGKIGEWKYYFENGELESIGSYSHGIKDGLWIYYYDNGQIRKRENYKDHKIDGSCLLYHKNGQLMVNGNYLNGKKDKTWELYYDNGKIQLKGVFKNGELPKKWDSFDEMGELSLDGIGNPIWDVFIEFEIDY
jgi:antitoxin component YwqK of YwqJK toxin-antitoxin module